MMPITTALHDSRNARAFADDVHYYLSLRPRQLPSRYLYDALGSALFEAICRLPWYRVTRAEQQLLETHGREIFRRLDPLSTFAELGPGSGEKLAALIVSGRRRPGPLRVHLVDVSAAALDAASRLLGGLEDVTAIAHHGTYEVGLAEVGRRTRGSGRMLVLFLGSNIGNFDPPGADAFLRAIRSALVPGEALLIGADLVKDERDLLSAYDDPLGVTAAFNRNLLLRINRELGGDIDLDAFTHRAIWNAAHSRVEMHLVSRKHQRITIPDAAFDFTIAEGESIWTESSYKYQPAGIVSALTRAGFRLADQWVDDESGFALTLAEV
ncbi:MAG: L-histidine N(alpha)-methyltransferase [Acidobacteriota bacterium]